MVMLGQKGRFTRTGRGGDATAQHGGTLLGRKSGQEFGVWGFRNHTCGGFCREGEEGRGDRTERGGKRARIGVMYNERTKGQVVPMYGTCW